MNFYLRILFSVILLNSIFALTSFAQKAQEIYDPPIVYGNKNDNLPDKIKISGTITDLTFGAGCGVIAFAGTLKIRLDRKIENYPYEYVYLVKSCFGDFEKFGTKRKKYIGKQIEIEVSKLIEDDRKKGSCSFDTVINSLKSNGIPFYCTGYEISAAIKK